MIEDQHSDTGVPPSEQPAPQAAPQSSEPVSEVSLEDFLSEFERETAPKQQAEASQTEPQDPKTHFDKLAEDFRVALAGGAATKADAEALVRQVQGFGALVQNLTQIEQRRQDEATFKGAITKAENLLKQYEIPVGADFVENWFRAQSTLDPALVAAFDERGHSNDARRYQKLEAKAIERLIKAAKREPDPLVTEDRWMVAAAVRGSAHGPPEERPVDVTTLSEPEFRNLLRTKWGLG